MLIKEDNVCSSIQQSFADDVMYLSFLWFNRYIYVRATFENLVPCSIIWALLNTPYWLLYWGKFGCYLILDIHVLTIGIDSAEHSQIIFGYQRQSSWQLPLIPKYTYCVNLWTRRFKMLNLTSNFGPANITYFTVVVFSKMTRTVPVDSFSCRFCVNYFPPINYLLQ